MRFSIIIPAYNAEAYLQRCLDSIFSQEFDDFEVIVINDGSSDGTSVLLDGYTSKHSNLHILSQNNQGMATARNRGLDAAQGDYILFVDSDDELMPHTLSNLASQINGEDIIGFGSSIYNEETQTITHYPLHTTHYTLHTGWDYFNCHRLEATPVHFVCVWQRAYRRAFLEECGLRFVNGLRRAEDDLFTTMVMLHAKSVKTMANSLYIYHVRKGSITRTSNSKLDADSWHVQQILADTFIPMQGIDKTAIYQVLASNYINHISVKGNIINRREWEQFHEACITPRHLRLYHIAHISPALFRLYSFIAGIFHR